METSIKPAAQVRAHLVVAATKHKLPYWHYKLLAEWLECYQYVLPNQRALRIIPDMRIKVREDAMHIWQLCDLYECTLLPYEQLLLAQNQGKGFVCAISP